MNMLPDGFKEGETPLSAQPAASRKPSVIIDDLTGKTRQILNPKPGRYDVPDPLTGENVVNIPVYPIPDAMGRRIMSSIDRALEYTTRGGVADIRSLVQACEAPLPGFIEVFTPEQRARLATADHELCMHLNEQMSRLILGDRVNILTKKMTAALHREVVPYLSRVTPGARASIENAIALWEKNRSNPYQNMYYRTAQPSRKDQRWNEKITVALLQDNVDCLSMQIMDHASKADNTGAGFSPTYHAVAMQESPQEYDFIDALHLLHELTHGVQAKDFLRKGSGTPDDIAARHARFISCIDTEDASRVAYGILEHEYESIGNEAEILLARLGAGSFVVQEATQRLGLRPQRMRSVNELLQYASRYFPHARTNGIYAPEFRQYLESEYRRLGIHILTLSPEGIPMKKE